LGIAGDSAGRLYGLQYDSMGDWSRAEPCTHPGIGLLGGRERLECGKGEYLPWTARAYAGVDIRRR